MLADTPELLQQVDLSGNPELERIKTTLEGIKVLGAAISKNPEFHAAHIQEVVDEAHPALQAITAFGKEHLQQALALLRSTYMTKFSYLTRVTPPHIVSPHLQDILHSVRLSTGELLDYDLEDSHWGQCLLKPKLGGIGIMDIASTAYGAYYASILACLPVIGKIDEAQGLDLSPTLFLPDGFPQPSNAYANTIRDLHEEITCTYDKAMEIDRDLSMQVLHSLPEERAPTPGAITPPDKQDRIIAVNTIAAVPLPPPRAKKLQSFFSDKTSRVARHRLMQSLPPEDVIRIHSASDEGAAFIQARPTSPNNCFQSIEFKVLLYLRT